MRKLLFFSVLLIVWTLQACTSDPVETRERHFERAEEYFARQQYDEATIEYMNALKADESYVPARLGLAKTHFEAGRYQNAVDEAKKVLEEDPESIEAKLMLADMYLLSGSQNPEGFKETRRLAQEVIDADPSNVKARILLGNAYAGLRDIDRAVEELETLLEHSPSNLAARLNLGAFEMSRREQQKAEATFKTAVQQHPDSSEAHRALGNYYAAAKDYEAAEKSFSAAFELEQSTKNLLPLVKLYLVQGKQDEAEATFERAFNNNPENVEFALGLVSLRESRGNLEGAKGVLEDLRRRFTDNHSVAAHLAEFYLRHGETREATSLTTKLLAEDPNSAVAHYLQARLLIREDDLEEALDKVNRALELNNRLNAAYLVKAQIQMESQKLADAEQTLREAVSITPNYLPARANLAKVLAFRNKSEAALAEAEVVLRRDPDNTDALIARGEANLKERRLEAAEQDFEQIKTLNPGDPYPYHRLGAIEVLRSSPEKALTLFRQALSLNPDLSDVVNDVIVVYGQRQDWTGALRELDRLEAEGSSPGLIQMFRGQIYLQEGKGQQARAALQKATQLNPDNYQAYLLLGQANLVEKNYPAAIQEIDYLLEKNPSSSAFHMLKGYYHEVAGDKAGAIQSYRKALEAEPDNAIAANNLAWILAEEDRDLNEARSLAERARRQQPQNPSIADTLGWIYYKQGNYVLAIDQLLFSVNTGNPDAGNYYRLGMAYLKKGDRHHAHQTLRKALSMDPNFEHAEEARRAMGLASK